VNESLRNVRGRRSGETPPLPLDLHFLLSVWSKNPDVELTVLGWAMRHLHENPLLDRSLLGDEGGFRPDEVIHVAPEELSNEDLLRLWAALPPSYRPSYSYVARVVVLEPDAPVTGKPVVATRFSYGDNEDAG